MVDLFEALMRGDIAAALAELRAQYDIGADPAVVLTDLAEFTHFVTRVKVVPAVADDVSLSEAERERGREFATQLSMRVLSRTWQMLLKGIGEVQASGKPVAAAEMAGADCLCRRPADTGRSRALVWARMARRRRVRAAMAERARPDASQNFAPRSGAARLVAFLRGGSPRGRRKIRSLN